MQGQQCDPTRIQLFTAQTTREWMEWSGFTLADVVNEDETPAAKLGAVGFVKAPRGAKTDFDFPYDEVCIVTKGRCRVRSMSGVATAGPGELIYLPAHLPGTFEALDDMELVYVASSPYGAANREMKAQLLAAARQ
jgi:ethanolamine utilization protein EutQ (cupin superfamily)